MEVPDSSLGHAAARGKTSANFQWLHFAMLRPHGQSRTLANIQVETQPQESTQDVQIPMQ